MSLINNEDIAKKINSAIFPGIPFDPEKPTVTSGVRLGTPARTTRGFGEAEFHQIGAWIVEVVDGLAQNGEEGNAGAFCIWPHIASHENYFCISKALRMPQLG